MKYIKPAILFTLGLLTVGAPGQADLGNATAPQAIMQMVICVALIALISRFKVVMLYGYRLLLRLQKAPQAMPRNVQRSRR